MTDTNASNNVSGVEWMIRTVPLLAPLPTAWIVGRAMLTVMDWPWPVALIGALIIEGLGFGTMDTAMRMRDYNRRRRKRFDPNKGRLVYLDPAAPTHLAVVIMFLYVAVALALTVLMEIMAELVTYVPGIFPFLGLLGAGLWALRMDHERRMRDMTESRQEIKEARKEARLLHGERRTRSRAHKGVEAAELLAFWREKPEASDNETAEHFGVRRQAIQQRRRKLLAAGVIRREDGRTVEVKRG